MSRKRDYQIDGPEVTAIKQCDPALIPLFDTVGNLRVVGYDDPFLCIMFFVLNQQISLKAAKTVYDRLMVHGIVTPESVLRVSDPALRALGLTTAKVTCLKSLAAATATAWFQNLALLPRSEVERHLLALPGIGPWTVAMFNLFYRFDEDVFTTTDLGLRQALRVVLNNPEMSHQDIQVRSIRWRPYRSVVAHYLWAFREGPNSHL